VKIANEIIYFGKLIDEKGLVSSHAGNISVRVNENILITKSGTMLGRLTSKDLTCVEIGDKKDKNLHQASMETVVHEAIYKNSNAKAVIHTHPVYSIILSFFLKDRFIPIDSEGKFVLKEVPIISAEKTISSKEVADKIGKIANLYPVAIIKSHGVFAWSSSVEKAFYLTTALENSAKIFYLTEKWKKENS